MKIKKLVTLLLVFILAFSVVGSAFAQEEEPPACDPATDPTCEEPPACDPATDPTCEEPTDEGYTHPIVALFQAYWDLVNPEEPACDPATDPTCEEPPACDPATDPTCEEPPTECVPYGEEPGEGQEGLPECAPEFGELIASLHEDGMGFGVMANILAIATACEPEEGGDPCPTFEELVAAFQGGMGVGQLYKEYGNPGQHGVGYIKKALKCAEVDPAADKVPGYCKDKGDKGGGPPEGKGGGNPHDD